MGRLADQKRALPPLCLVWSLLLLLQLHISASCFGKFKQEPLDSVRERSGQTYRTKAAMRVSGTLLTEAEVQLLTSISRASEARQWSVVASLFAQYTGSSSQIYSAAMKGAFRCQKYKAGTSMYDKWLQVGGPDQEPVSIHEPVFVFAIKMFGKLGEAERVRKVYQHALDVLKLSTILAAARIDAAADEGDVETAKAVLENMENSSVGIDVAHMTSAIRASHGWEKDAHKAAKDFFGMLPRLRLKADIVLFTSLVRAYHTASLNDLLLVYREMKDLKIVPNSVFAETYIVSLLQTDAKIGLPRELQALCNILRDKPIERLQAAQKALSEFKEDKVKLSGLSKNIERALRRLSQ